MTQSDRLYDGKCPTINCKEGRVKTTLREINPDHIICDKCGGEWKFVCYTPFDVNWIIIKKPFKNS